MADPFYMSVISRHIGHFLGCLLVTLTACNVVASDLSRALTMRTGTDNPAEIRFGTDAFSNLDASANLTNMRFYHYSPFEYPIGHQLWDAIQLSDGKLVIADQSGIHFMSSSGWSRVTTDLGGTVRSLAYSPSKVPAEGEIVYYGAQSEIGLIRADSTGSLRAESLNHLLPDEIEFGDVWATHWTKEGIVFQSSGHLFIYDGSIQVIPASETFHNSFLSNGRVFVRERGVGLHVLEGNSLRKIEGGEVLADEMIFGITAEADGTSLVWARFSGIYKIDSALRLTHVNRYPRPLQTLSENYRLYAIEQIGSDEYAIGTLGGGLAFVNREADILSQLSEAGGLPDAQVNFLLRSNDGGLWTGFNSQGLGIFTRGYPIESYSRGHGITGTIYSIGKIDGRVSVATSKGVFRASNDLSDDGSESHFYSPTPVVDTFDQLGTFGLTWDFYSSEDGILISTEQGVRFSDDNGSTWSSCSVSGQRDNVAVKAYGIVEDPYNERLLVGLEQGVAAIEFSVLRESSCRLEKVEQWSSLSFTRDILVTASGLIFETRYDGAFWVDLTDGKADEEPVEIHGTPAGIIDIEVVDDRTFMVHADEGLFELLPSDGVLKAVPIEAEHVFPKSDRIFAISEAPGDRIVVVFEDRVSFVTRPSMTRLSKIESPASLQFSKTETSSVMAEASGLLWFNNGSELIRYDPRYDVEDHKVFNAHISSVKRAADGETLFGGFYRADNGGITSLQPAWSIPTLDYESRNLTFQFAATEFINPEGVQYRYRIDGAQPGEWSEWSDEREAMTPSIDEGAYTMVVQAKDEIGRLSSTASYQFVILPPWYRTIWAYLAYLILGAAAMVSGRKYIHMRRAHKLAAEQAKELEREREVVKKLSEANDRLLQANKLKDEFLATTSHELRTPLTAILGFTSVLKDEIPQDADYREFLDIIEDSGSRLMDTLNSLLDLAKLRAGIMEINMEAVDLYQACFQEVVQLQNAAQNKGLKLRVRKPNQPIHAMADVYGLNRVLHNLVGNAIKFTDEGGVEVWFEYKTDSIDIHVTDTGIGIDAEFLPELFNAFIQESDGLSRTHEGTGLGLAITSGIIGLMEASIRVESEKGKGSDFIVSLKKADAPRQRPRRFSGMGNTASA